MTVDGNVRQLQKENDKNQTKFIMKEKAFESKIGKSRIGPISQSYPSHQIKGN